MADNSKDRDKDKGKQNANPTNPPAADPPLQQDAMYMTLTHEALIELIREARRDPAREAELEKEAERIRRRRQQMVKIAKHDEDAKVRRQQSCRHRKPNGEETSGGQEFSDGRVRIFCLRCQTILREYWSPEVARGMAIERKMRDLGVTDEDVKKAMEFRGQGNPDADLSDDFLLGMPRGLHGNEPSVTTES